MSLIEEKTLADHDINVRSIRQELKLLEEQLKKHGRKDKQIDRIECAIRHIQTAADVDPWACEIAVEAMRKQIPQKPIEKPEKYNEDLWHLYCPSCENWIGIWNSRVKHGDMYNNSNSHICPYCGQAIDWEDEG